MRIERPRRRSYSYEQTIDGSPEKIFPLYCPVREAEWVFGWDPIAVYSDSGRVEADCVFTTREGERDSIWAVTAYDPGNYQVEMLKVTPGVTVCKLEIALHPGAEGQTKALITYTHTSLGPEGDQFMEERFTEHHYQALMVRWETAMNHYLRTGEQLAPPP